MAKYDNYYEEEHHFGDPSPELISFFAEREDRGKILDLGCGQGRDALALASLGYEITGVDISKVGVDQMIGEASRLDLDVIGIIADIYEFPIDSSFDFIILDSMLHFYKRDREKEEALVRRIMSEMRVGAVLCILVNKSRTTEPVLESVLNDINESWTTLQDRYAQFPKMNSLYRMVIIQKE